MQTMRTMGLALLVLGMALTVVAVAEDVTVSTYYPSPKGVYQQLSTTGQTVLATNGGNVGIGTAAPAFTLHVNGTCNITGPATLNTVTTAGAATFNNGLTVATGAATFNNGLTVTAGNTQVGALNAGATNVASFRLPAGAANGEVLTTDGAGNADWRPIVYQ